MNEIFPRSLEEAMTLLGDRSMALVYAQGWAVVEWSEEQDAYVWYSGQDWETWQEAYRFVQGR